MQNRLVLHILAVLSAAAAAGASPVRIAVIGDRTGSEEPGIYPRIVAEAARLGPDLVLTVGDQIEGPVEDTAEIKGRWREYWELMRPLKTPIRLAAGNNDIFDDRSEGLFRRLAGDPYRSFDFRGVHVVFLDNSRWESAADMPAAQIKWLVGDLKESKGRPFTLVVMHKPFWASTLPGSPDTLHRLFIKYGVDAVFSGHWHQYFSAEFDGIRYTSVGSSGGGADAGPTGLRYLFAWVVVGDSGIDVSPVPLGGIRPWNEVTLSDIRAIDTLDRSAIAFDGPAILDENSQLADSVARVSLFNPGDTLPFADSLRWETSPGWAVSPGSVAISLTPNGTTVASFALRRTGPVYPVPSLSLKVPYAPGKTHAIRRSLPVCQTASCMPAASPPRIDGQPTEKCWRTPLTRLTPVGKAPVESTEVYFSYDGANLYLAAVCRETRPGELAAGASQRDGPVYTEDCVGFFLCPDTLQKTVYQVYFNPQGTIFDQKVTFRPDGQMDGDVAWNCDCAVRTAVEGASWRLEASLPLAQFGGQVQPGDSWKLNVRRKQRRLRATADWQTPLEYDHKTFGRLLMR